MQMLHDAGYHTVTPEQITAWREGVLDLPHDALLLTFDDGRTDTVLNAAPILKRVGMRATVFAIGGAWKRSPLYEASPDGLRSLQRQGWSIEAHASAPARERRRRRRAPPPVPQRPPLARTGSSRRWPQFRRRAAIEYSNARKAAAGDRAPARRRVRLALRRLRRRHAHERPPPGGDQPPRGPARLQPRLQRGRPDDVQPAHAGDRPDAHRALRDRAHAHSPPAVRAPRAGDRRDGAGGVPCRLGRDPRPSGTRCVCHLASPPSSRQPWPRPPPARPPPSAGAPPRPPCRRADGARADGHAPHVGGARVALGASVVDRAARACVARAAARRAFRLQRRGCLHCRPRARAVRGSFPCSRTRSIWPGDCSPTGPCGAGWRFA